MRVETVTYPTPYGAVQVRMADGRVMVNGIVEEVGRWVEASGREGSQLEGRHAVAVLDRFGDVVGVTVSHVGKWGREDKDADVSRDEILAWIEACMTEARRMGLGE